MLDVNGVALWLHAFFVWKIGYSLAINYIWYSFFFSPFYLFLMRMSAIKMKKKKKTWMNQQGILFLCVSRVNVCRVGLWQFSFFLMDSNTRICTRYHSQITKLHTLTLLDTFETTLIEFISKILFNCFFFFIVIAFVHFVSQHRKEV